MSDSSRLSAPAAPVDTAYRAVSLWAVAGLGLAGVYAAWVLIAAVLAFRSHLPLLMHPATLLLPLTAFGLSAVGWVEIRRAEGTRVGLRLAGWGLFLSLLFGLGYGTYRGVLEYALRQQARDFTLQWLEQVKASPRDEVEGLAAFWNTLEPMARDRNLDLNNPETRKKLAAEPKELTAVRDGLRRRYFWGEDGQKGRLPEFFEHELIQRLRQVGTAESLGVRDWEYLPGAAGGYWIEQTYRITTPQATFEAVIPVLRQDRERRHWQVLITEARIQNVRLSALGSQMRDLRLDSGRFAKEWVQKLREGQGPAAFLATLPGVDRLPLRGWFADEVELHENYPHWFSGTILSARGLTAEPKRERSEMYYEASTIFDRAAPGKRVAFDVTAAYSQGQLMPEELRFFHPFVLTAGKYRFEGRIVVATDDPALLRKMRQASEAGASSPEAPHLGRQASWRIVGMELETGRAVAPIQGASETKESH